MAQERLKLPSRSVHRHLRFLYLFRFYSFSGVVVYSVRRSKDEDSYRRWLEVLGIDDGRPAVHACQRHFPAGAPTRNHPDPNPNLFNPIPNQVWKIFFQLFYIY